MFFRSKLLICFFYFFFSIHSFIQFFSLIANENNINLFVWVDDLLYCNIVGKQEASLICFLWKLNYKMTNVGHIEAISNWIITKTVDENKKPQPDVIAESAFCEGTKKQCKKKSRTQQIKTIDRCDIFVWARFIIISSDYDLTFGSISDCCTVLFSRIFSHFQTVCRCCLTH